MVDKPRYNVPETGRLELKTTSGSNCWFAYLYRDADNYKVHNRILLRGAWSEEHMETLRKYALHDFDQFCAEDMDLNVQYPWAAEVHNRPFDESIDDFWHEVDDFYPSPPLTHRDKRRADFAEAEHVLSFIQRFVRRSTLYGWSAPARQSAYMGWTDDYTDPEAKPTYPRFGTTSI